MGRLGSFLCSPNAHESKGFYPVAKINKTGSGSNKFCLAKLVEARSRRSISPHPRRARVGLKGGWEGENRSRTFEAKRATLKKRVSKCNKGWQTLRALGVSLVSARLGGRVRKAPRSTPPGNYPA